MILVSGKIFANGKIEEIEVSNFNNAFLNSKMNIENSTLESGQTTECCFSATINLKDLISDVYYKYAISYEVDGEMKYFYYTIKILTNN